MLGWHQLGSMRVPTGFMALHAEDLLECTMKLSYRPQAAIAIPSTGICMHFKLIS